MRQGPFPSLGVINFLAPLVVRWPDPSLQVIERPAYGIEANVKGILCATNHPHRIMVQPYHEDARCGGT